MVDRMRAMRRPGECYSEVILRLVELEAGRRLPPKMTPAQIAEAQRMAREWKRLGAPRKSSSPSARWTNVRLQGKGLLLGLREPFLALLMKLGVALAQPVQSRFDPHHGFDAEGTSPVDVDYPGSSPA